MSNPIPTPNYSYTTETGYKFPYLSQDPNIPYNGDYDLKDILEESCRYHRVHWARISKAYYAYLKHELHITEPDGEGNSNYYMDLSEGTLITRTLPDDYYIDIALWLDNPLDLQDINTILFNKISRSAYTSFKQGLDTFLDRNHGGNINQNSLDIACLMIYG